MTDAEPIAMTVDGQDFLVHARADDAGVYDFAWLTGPPGYGFTVAKSDRTVMTPVEAAEVARNFLAQTDPETGHLE